MAGPFILTRPIASAGSSGGSETHITTSLVFTPTGAIPFFGFYTETKPLVTDGTGLVTFYPTVDGLITGDNLFDEIKTVDSLAFLITDAGSSFRQPLSTGFSINPDNSVTIRVIEAVEKTTLLGRKRKNAKPAISGDIQVTIKIGGQLKEEYHEQAELQNLSDRITELETFGDSSFLAATNMSRGRAVYVNGSGKIAYANYSDETQARTVFGILAESATINTLATVQTHQVMTNSSWTWTPQQPVYLALSGNLTQDVSGFSVVVELGIALTSTKMLIRVQPPVYL